MTESLRVACAKAIHVVDSEGRVHRGGRAVLFILGRTGWGWFARFLMLPPMTWGVELGYRLVASNRAFFGKFLFRRE